MSAREAFVSGRRARWERLDRLVSSRGPRDAAEWTEVASLYRGLCADLSTAQSLELSEDVRAHLDDLAGRAHNMLYGTRRGSRLRLVHTLAVEFPREVRRSWVFFVLATVLFYGPFLIGLVGPTLDGGFAAAVLPEAQLRELEQMYATADIGRSAQEDTAMTGFYVRNNIGIALRCFATGVLAGLGPLFFLVYNGLVLGTSAGHLSSVGLGGNLLAFVVGHSAWELTGIVLSGAAGLRLGWALVDTGGRTRAGSLRAAAHSLYRLLAGTVAFIAIAAVIEGLWSGHAFPMWLKLGFGGLQWVIVFGWMGLGGRGNR